MNNNDKIFVATVMTGVIFMAVMMALSPIPAIGAEISADWYLGYTTAIDLDADFCQMVGIDEDEVVFYQPDDLGEVFVSWDGNTVVVEKIIGICTNNDSDGEILNTNDLDHNYIRYSNDDICEGDIVLSYCIYNLADGYEDDIDRYDYVIDTDQLIEEID